MRWGSLKFPQVSNPSVSKGMWAASGIHASVTVASAYRAAYNSRERRKSCSVSADTRMPWLPRKVAM